MKKIKQELINKLESCDKVRVLSVLESRIEILKDSIDSARSKREKLYFQKKLKITQQLKSKLINEA